MQEVCWMSFFVFFIFEHSLSWSKHHSPEHLLSVFRAHTFNPFLYRWHVEELCRAAGFLDVSNLIYYFIFKLCQFANESVIQFLLTLAQYFLSCYWCLWLSTHSCFFLPVFVHFLSYLNVVHYRVQVKAALQQAKGRQQKRQHRNVSPSRQLCCTADRAVSAGCVGCPHVECVTITASIRRLHGAPSSHPSSCICHHTPPLTDFCVTYDFWGENQFIFQLHVVIMIIKCHLYAKVFIFFFFLYVLFFLVTFHVTCELSSH